MYTPFKYPVKALAVAALLSATACGQPAPEPQGRPSITSGGAVALADVQGVGLMNAAMPLENVVTGGQPTPEQLSALVDLGYTNFVSLRPATEEGTGWEEAIVSDEGISFQRIPVAGAEGLTRENVEALDRALDEAGAEGTVLYCGSSTRVGAMLALRAYWLDGADAQTALELGREAGMSRLEPAVTELFAAR